MKIDVKTLTYPELVRLAHIVAYELAVTPASAKRDSLRRANLRIADEHRDRLWSNHMERQPLAM